MTSEKPSEFQKVYDRLGIRLTERGESFYQKRMEVLVKELEERGLLIEEDGRKLLWADGISIPFTIVKSDGGMYHCRPRIMLFPCAVIGWMCWWRNSRTIGFKLLKTNLVSAISEFAIKKRYPSLSNGSGHKNILQFLWIVILNKNLINARIVGTRYTSLNCEMHFNNLSIFSYSVREHILCERTHIFLRGY